VEHFVVISGTLVTVCLIPPHHLPRRCNAVARTDLDYISSDPYDVESIVDLDQRLSLRDPAFTRYKKRPVKALVIGTRSRPLLHSLFIRVQLAYVSRAGVSKSHFITVIAYLDRSAQPRCWSLLCCCAWSGACACVRVLMGLGPMQVHYRRFFRLRRPSHRALISVLGKCTTI
jgi:hypothetical protein